MKIKIKLTKNILNIKGDGDIYIGDELEQLSYSIINNDGKITFDTKLNITKQSINNKFFRL